MFTNNLRIIFLGTPAFAVESLKVLVENNYNIAAVITAPDKPAGRGQQIKHSAVKEFALKHQLKILQPVKLTDEKFLEEVRNLKADIQVVVAFRMMPEVLWNMPRLGTFNLHASLLPQYRGAAPINRAIMNGEKETGITTFFLKQEIDTGNIIFREKVEIGEEETAGEVHDKLMLKGAQLVLKTIEEIKSGNVQVHNQSEYVKPGEELKHAPKIFKEDCRIKWNEPADQIYNLIRGLSPYPAAFTKIKSPDGKELFLKIFKTENPVIQPGKPAGSIETDSQTYLRMYGANGFLNLKEIQLEGKRKMNVEEFMKGFKMDN